MISTLSFNDKKDVSQINQYHKSTSYISGLLSPQNSTQNIIQNNKTFRDQKAIKSVHLSPNQKDDLDKIYKNGVTNIAPTKLEYFNTVISQQKQRNNNPSNQGTQMHRRVQSSNIYKSTINQICDNQNNNGLISNQMNSPINSPRGTAYSFAQGVLIPAMKQPKKITSKINLQNHDNRKMSFNKSQLYKKINLVRNINISQQQEAAKLKDQNLVKEARAYNLDRMQSKVLKRNEYILKHEVKDYKESLDQKFQLFYQQKIKNEKLFHEQNEDSANYLIPQSNQLIQNPSSKFNFKDQNISDKIKNEITPYLPIHSSNKSPQNEQEELLSQQKSYDQVIEETNMGIIEVNFPNKEDVYKLWKQTKSTVDHIHHHTKNPSLSPSKQLKYQPFAIIDKITSSKNKSISTHQSSNFSHIISPKNIMTTSINKDDVQQNIAELVKETKNQFYKMKELQKQNIQLQNESNQFQKSQDITPSSTLAGSPNLNYIVSSSNNNTHLQIDNNDERKQFSQNITFQEQNENQPYLSPKSSSRKKIINRIDRPWSTKKSQFLNQQKDFITEFLKIQPQIKSLNQVNDNAQIQSNKNISTRPQTGINSYLQNDRDQFLFQYPHLKDNQNKSSLQGKKQLNLQQLQININSQNEEQRQQSPLQSCRSQNSKEESPFKKQQQRQQQGSRSNSPLPSYDNLSPLSSKSRKMKSQQFNFKKQAYKKQDSQDLKRLNFLDEMQKQKKLMIQSEMIQRKLKINQLTKQEIQYFANQRKKYFEPLKDDLESIKMSFGMEEEKFMDVWGILYQKTIYDIYDSMNSLPDEENNYQIKQTYICKEEEGLFEKVMDVNQVLKQCHKQLTRKFVRFVKMGQDGEIQRQRFKEANKLNQYEVCKNKLNLEELNLLTEQLKLDVYLRDYETIDGILQKLQFFKKYSLIVCRQIINIGQIIIVPKNQIIFQQGEIADNMYVILKDQYQQNSFIKPGSVHVRVRRQEDPLITIKDPVVTSLYDGYPFGDLALINLKLKTSKNALEMDKILTLKQMREQIQESQLSVGNNNLNERKRDSSLQNNGSTPKDIRQKIQRAVQKKIDKSKHNKQTLISVFQEAAKNNNKRSATIEAAEECHLLSISRENFSNILLNLILNEMNGKLELLKKIPFLADLEYANLITLANYMEIKKMNLGDIVVREGQEPQYFYILQKGRCEIVKEEIIVRKRNFIGGRQYSKPPKRFDFSQPKDNLTEFKSVFQENHQETIDQGFNHDFFDVINENYNKSQHEIEDESTSQSQSLDFDYYKGVEGELKQDKPQIRATIKRSNLNGKDLEKQLQIDQAIQSHLNNKDIRPYKKLYEDQEELAYCYFHSFGSLQEGDIFMFRSFIAEQSKVDSSILDEIDYNPNEKARMTIVDYINYHLITNQNLISETSITEVAMIDRQYIHLVAPNLKRLLLDGLVSMKDFDHTFTKESREWIDRWDQLKIRIFKDQKKYNQIK